MNAKDIATWMFDLIEQDMVDEHIIDLSEQSRSTAGVYPPNDPRRKVFEGLADVADAVLKERLARREPGQSECAALWLADIDTQAGGVQ